VTVRLWRGCAGPKRDQIVYGPIPDGRSIDKWLWLDPDSFDGIVGCTDDDVSDLVPLVTLTEDDARVIAKASLQIANPSAEVQAAYSRFCAQLAPPRMSEPTEFGAMVEASLKGDPERRAFVHCSASDHEGRTVDWHDSKHVVVYAWSGLVDPRPIGGDS
jgi:hypothetical protein